MMPIKRGETKIILIINLITLSFNKRENLLKKRCKIYIEVLIIYWEIFITICDCYYHKSKYKDKKKKYIFLYYICLKHKKIYSQIYGKSSRMWYLGIKLYLLLLNKNTISLKKNKTLKVIKIIKHLVRIQQTLLWILWKSILTKNILIC